MLQSACSGAGLNVRINLTSLNDEQFVRQTTEKMMGISRKVEQLAGESLLLVNRSMG
jgi:formiminotetrahydrofolate cyclodeaminase